MSFAWLAALSRDVAVEVSRQTSKGRRRVPRPSLLEPMEKRILLSTYTLTQAVPMTSATGSGSESGVAVDPSGDVFGVTNTGGRGDGAIFELAAGSTTLTALASFNGTNGSGVQYGSPVLDSSGDLSQQHSRWRGTGCRCRSRRGRWRKWWRMRCWRRA